MVSEIQAGQTSSRRPPAHLDTMGENNTPTALKDVPFNSQGHIGTGQMPNLLTTRPPRTYPTALKDCRVKVVQIPLSDNFMGLNLFIWVLS